MGEMGGWAKCMKPTVTRGTLPLMVASIRLRAITCAFVAPFRSRIRATATAPDRAANSSAAWP